MNQMSQEPVQESQSQDAEAQSAASPATPEPRPRPAHPRFAKPQRVAFVQSAWHREVVAECRMAFLDEAEARNIPRAAIDVFEVPGS